MGEIRAFAEKTRYGKGAGIYFEDETHYAFVGSRDDSEARAARLAAGWNLLEELEKMDALGILEGSRASVETMGWDATSQRLARIEDSIRTALKRE